MAHFALQLQYGSSGEEEEDDLEESGISIEQVALSSSRITASSSKCDVCQKEPSKYTCPNCSIHSCSLTCSKTHKEHFKCSGERSKNHYVSLQNFTYSDLMSDYTYLEDIGRKADTIARDLTTKGLKPIPKRMRKDEVFLTQHKYKNKMLIRQAKFRGVDLRLLPEGMQRRAQNGTFHYKKHDKEQFWWTIEWLADGEKILDRRHLDTSTIEECFSKHRAKIQGSDHVFLLKNEPSAANKPSFYHMDKSKTLGDVLKNKIIIEYPQIHVYSEIPREVKIIDESNTQEEESADSADSSTEEKSSEESSADEETNDITVNVEDADVDVELSDDEVILKQLDQKLQKVQQPS